MSAPPAPGFADPVFDAQSTFRAVLTALSRPGLTDPLVDLPAAVPAPLTAELAAVALALCDGDAPIWLDAPLAADGEVARYLRFHTGAPVVTEPGEAAFALVSDPRACPPLASFATGTDEYPDRSATLVLAVESLSAGERLVLTGPGIRGEVAFAASPLPPDLAGQLAENGALFPRGVDLILVARGAVLGLPRSARLGEAA